MSQIPHGWTEAEEQAFQAYSARILEREQEARRTDCMPPTHQEPACSLAAPAGSESGACTPDVPRRVTSLRTRHFLQQVKFWRSQRRMYGRGDAVTQYTERQLRALASELIAGPQGCM